MHFTTITFVFYHSGIAGSVIVLQNVLPQSQHQHKTEASGCGAVELRVLTVVEDQTDQEVSVCPQQQNAKQKWRKQLDAHNPDTAGFLLCGTGLVSVSSLPPRPGHVTGLGAEQ